MPCTIALWACCCSLASSVRRRLSPATAAWVRYDRADGRAGRVDRLLDLAVLAAQVAVVGLLDARLPGGADHGQLLVVGAVVDVLQRDRADEPDQVRVERPERPQRRVAALVDVLELHAVEEPAPLEHVRGLAAVDVERQRHRVAGVGARQVREHVPHARIRHVQHPRQTLQHPALRLHRHRLLRALRDRARDGLGHPRRVDLHREPGRVRHDHIAVAVEDVAARRRHDDRAHAVLRGRGHVLVGVQHLQRPQPEEEDAEQHRGDHAQRRRPHRKRHRVGRRLGPRRRPLQIHWRASVPVGRAAAAAAAGSGRAGSSAGSTARSGATAGSRSRSRCRAAPARRRG